METDHRVVVPGRPLLLTFPRHDKISKLLPVMIFKTLFKPRVLAFYQT